MEITETVGRLIELLYDIDDKDDEIDDYYKHILYRD